MTRRSIRVAGLTIALTALVGLGPGAGLTAEPAAADHPPVKKAQIEQWKTDLSNWGRWGKDDEIGALNLITPAKRKQAVALVRDGVSVSMALDADTIKSIDNPQPYDHKMQGIGADYIGVAMHGWAHTHLDSLAHVNYSGVFYNGYKPDPAVVAQQNGHAKNSIGNMKNGILTRGILVDIPRLKGLPYLEPGTPIYVEDLEAWEKKAGVKIGSGDALFVRTGVWPYRQKFGPYVRGRNGKDAGLDATVIPWLKRRDIAVLGSDHPQGVNPSETEMPNAVHDFALVSLGIPLFDNCDLEALAAAAASKNRWEFMFSAAPLPVRGATGSPINPIATF
jgi:kynurenine formamidase